MKSLITIFSPSTFTDHVRIIFGSDSNTRRHITAAGLYKRLTFSDRNSKASIVKHDCSKLTCSNGKAEVITK